MLWPQRGERGGEILAGEALGREERIERSVAEQVVQFAWPRPGAERHRDRAKRGGAEHRLQPFAPVLGEHADPAAAPDAARLEPAGDAGGGVEQLAIRRRLSACDDRGPVAEAPGLSAQQRKEGLAGQPSLHSVIARF